MTESQFWLVKTEPDSYSIDHLAAEAKQTTFWDGVRNYQARNFMRAMRPGDRLLFYHSGANPPCVAGIAEIVRTAYPDFTALDPTNHHYDPKSTPENPIWEMVDVRFVEKFAAPLPLNVLRATRSLAGMELLRQGSRLSVQPVSGKHFEIVLELAKHTQHPAPTPATARPATKKTAKKRTTKRAVKKK